MAKLNERVKRFHLQPLPYHLTVVVTNDINASIKKRRLPDQNDPSMRACVFSGKNSNVAVMFLPTDVDFNTIAHEAAHVVWNIFVYADVNFDTELLAYYVGYLTGEIGDFVWYGNKKTKRAKTSQAETLVTDPQALTVRQ